MVVRNFRILSLADVYRNGFFHRNVVSIGNPADVRGIGLVRVRELGRAPALYWFSHELARADNDSEDDEEKDGVAMIEAVDPVIVVGPPEFGDGGDCS